MKRRSLPSKPNPTSGAERLRSRAEARLRGQPPKREAEALLPSDYETQRQFHELQVHQVELEMQNAELQEARDRLEVLLEKYRAVQEVQGRIAAIVDSSDDAIVGKDLQGIITSWNPGAERIFGYAAAEMVGHSILRLIPLQRRDEEKLILRRILTGKSVKHFETVRQTKDKRLIQVSITASPIRNAAGDIVGVSKVARDISEKKSAEAILQRSEALLSKLIRKAPIGVYMVDAQLRLRQVNPRARTVFRSIAHPLGREVSEIHHMLWPQPVAEQVMRRFRNTLRTGKPYQSPEFAERRLDTGVQEIYEWQLQRVTLPAGEHGVVCFFTNITDRRHAEDARRRLAVVSATNRKLMEEVRRRRAGEKALQKSEQHQLDLLAQSRRMQEHLRHLSRQVLQAQEEERRRVSRELHDVIAQTLTGINIRLANFKKASGVKTKAFEQSFARTHRMVEASVELVRRFARDLRPAVLDDLGLIPALHSHLEHFSIRTGVRSHLTASAAVEELDVTGRTVLFRVAQEALLNVARHAHATRADVTLEKRSRRVHMKIVDDGRSFLVKDAWHVRGRRRLGLLGMRERLEMVGGHFVIESVPGKGTTILADVPLTSRQRNPMSKSDQATGLEARRRTRKGGVLRTEGMGGAVPPVPVDPPDLNDGLTP